MKEFFILGVLCVLNPETYKPDCMTFHEEPIKFYTLEQCNTQAVKKVNEIGADFTSKGFYITRLDITCLVDKSKKKA